MCKSDIIIEKFRKELEKAVGSKNENELSERLNRLQKFQRTIRTRLYPRPIRPAYKPDPNYNYIDPFWNHKIKVWAHRKKIITYSLMVQLYEQHIKAIKTPAEYCRADHGDLRGDYGEILPPHQYPEFDLVRSDIWEKHIKEYCAASNCFTAVNSHKGFDAYGKGTVVSCGFYGVDYHEKQYVFKVCKTLETYKKNMNPLLIYGFTNMREFFFLVDHNEKNNPIVNPIPAQLVYDAIKKDPSIESPVRAAQKWILQGIQI